MKVRDFMITRVFTVKPTNTVEELLNILNTNRIVHSILDIITIRPV